MCRALCMMHSIVRRAEPEAPSETSAERLNSNIINSWKASNLNLEHQAGLVAFLVTSRIDSRQIAMSIYFNNGGHTITCIQFQFDDIHGGCMENLEAFFESSEQNVTMDCQSTIRILLRCTTFCSPIRVVHHRDDWPRLVSRIELSIYHLKA